MRGKKSAFAHKRTVMSRVKRKLREAHQGEWVPAHGGTETPFVTRTGRRLLYVYQRTTGRHAYLDLDTDIVLTDDEAWNALGRDPSGRRSRRDSSPRRRIVHGRASRMEDHTLILTSNGTRKVRHFPDRESALTMAKKIARARKGNAEVFLVVKSRKGDIAWSWWGGEGWHEHDPSRRDPVGRRLKRRMGRGGVHRAKASLPVSKVGATKKNPSRTIPKTYYTVVVPFVSVHPTKWHPNSREFSPVTRGAFDTKKEAHAWAKENLRGHRYKIKTIKTWRR